MHILEHSTPAPLKKLIYLMLREWPVLVISTALMIAAAIAFLAVTLKEYSTEARIIPLQDSELSQLILADVYKLDAKTAFSLAEQLIFSTDTAAEFIANNEELHNYLRKKYPEDDDSRMSRRFINSITLARPNARLGEAENSFLKLVFKYDERLDGEIVLNGYLAHVQNVLRRTIGSQITSAAKSEHERIDVEIASTREKLRMIREYKIAALSEALVIAKRINVGNIKTLSQLARENGRIINIAPKNTQEFPLYLLGVEALTSEISVLQARKNDDLDDTNIAALSARKMTISPERALRSLRPTTDMDKGDGVYFFVVVSKAEGPLRPDFPRKSIILILATILGFFFGIGYIASKAYLSDLIQ